MPDIVRMVVIITSSIIPNDEELCAGDVNTDGTIDILDVAIVVDVILNFN